MDLFSILTLLHLVKAVCTGTHSLWYFITLIEGPSPFPEMVIVGMVDDVPVEYYDSIDRMMTSRRHWHKEEGDVAYVQMKRLAIAHAAHSLKNKLQHMMEHFNHSVKEVFLLFSPDLQKIRIATTEEDRHLVAKLASNNALHTYQRIAGCELDDDGTERFRAKDSYNGKDVLSYDVLSYTWSSLVPEMGKDYWLMESYRRLFYQLYQPMCIRTLKNYLHQDGSILKRRVSPRVRVLQKQVGGAGGIEVTCLATGFYPRHIKLTLQRDNQPVLEEELISGDILPNGDGTYQLRLSLSVSAEELRKGHRYTCTVRHVSMDNKLDIAWESQPKSAIALISGASVMTLCAILLIVTGIVMLRKRKSIVPGCSRCSRSGNEEEKERFNVTEGVVKDAKGRVEMESQEE